MKRTVKLSLGFCIAMLTIALAAPHLSSPKLVLRFLPKDVYEAGKDHPAPSLPKRLLGHLLLVITAAYAVWAYRDISDGIRRHGSSCIPCCARCRRSSSQKEGRDHNGG